MKKILLAGLTLLLIFGLCFYAAARVETICDSITEKLHMAETQCHLGYYDHAINSVRDAQTLWTKHETFLGISLRHTETDEIGIEFPVLVETLMQKDSSAFIQENLTLIATIDHLSRMEQPYLFNIL